jgi:signal transduction histidine kinase
MENMQKRANEIGAVLKLQSAKGEGSLISLQLKTF